MIDVTISRGNRAATTAGANGEPACERGDDVSIHTSARSSSASRSARPPAVDRSMAQPVLPALRTAWCRLCGPTNGPSARVGRARGRLDAHDVGTEVREEASAQRPPVVGLVDHPEPRERPIVAHARLPLGVVPA